MDGHSSTDVPRAPNGPGESTPRKRLGHRYHDASRGCGRSHARDTAMLPHECTPAPSSAPTSYTNFPRTTVASTLPRILASAYGVSVCVCAHGASYTASGSHTTKSAWYPSASLRQRRATSEWDVSDERRATSDERRATSDERRATSDERRATSDERDEIIWVTRRTCPSGGASPASWRGSRTAPGGPPRGLRDPPRRRVAGSPRRQEACTERRKCLPRTP